MPAPLPFPAPAPNPDRSPRRPPPRDAAASAGTASLDDGCGPPADPPNAMNGARDGDREDQPLVLTFRTLSIELTPSFFALLAPVAPLLVVGVSLESVLAIALAILLAAVAIGSLGLCIATLLGLRLRVLPPSPGFAGDAVMLEVRVDNPGPRFRWDIGIGLASADFPGCPSPAGWIDVPPHAYGLALVPVAARERGRRPLPTLWIETRHPFGFARVGRRWTPAGAMQVFARPEWRPPRLPALRRGRGGAGAGAVVLDPMLARRREIGVRGDEGAGDADVERTVSRLSAWVLQAEYAGHPYGLRLGSVVVPPGLGHAHQRRCLVLLADWPGDE